MAAGDAVYKGESASMVKQPDSIEITAEDGKAYTKTYIGKASLVDAKVDAQLALGATRVDVTMGEPATVRAYIPYVGDRDGTWECVPEQFEKKLQAFAWWSSTDADRKWIEAIDEAIALGKSRDHNWQTEAPAGVSSTGFNQYHALRLAGTDSFLAYTYRIRCTKAFNAVDYPNGITFPNVGRVVSYLQIGVPVKTKWEQPTIYVCDSTSGAFTEKRINEWFSFPPSITRKGAGYTFTREWLGAEKWSGTLYDGGSGL